MRNTNPNMATIAQLRSALEALAPSGTVLRIDSGRARILGGSRL